MSTEKDMEQQAEKATLTEAEFAERLQISLRTAQRYRERKKLPHCKIGTRILYKLSHVDEWLAYFERRPKERRAA